MKKVDLESFQKRIKVRNLFPRDYEAVVKLQKACFPGQSSWTPQQFHRLLTVFPEGQFCVVYRGRVVASASCLIIDFDQYDETHTWYEVAGGDSFQNHDPDGDTIYGIEMMVSPRYQGMRLSRRLYDARKNLARAKNLRRMIIGGRIPGYEEHRETLSARDYVDRVLSKDIFDPVLTAQLANGFNLIRLLPGYMNSDRQSQGWATLLEWINLDWVRNPARRLLPSRQVRICAVQYQMRRIDSFEEFATQCQYFVDVAAGYRCDFVLFPELLTTQLLSLIPEHRPSVAARKVAEFTPQYLETFTQLAVRYNVNIIAGTHLTLEGDDLYNTAYLFQRNGEIRSQHKIHITPNERKWWGVKAGDHIDVYRTDKGTISMQVCYDIEFPELSRIAVQKGAEIIFVPFCTDERHAYLRVRTCAQARCIENHTYTVIAGTVGNLPQVENMDIQYAQSAILTPSDFLFARDGVAAECTPNVETVVIHDVDLELLRRHRRSGSTLNWGDRRLDLYEIHMKGEPVTAKPNPGASDGSKID